MVNCWCGKMIWWVGHLRLKSGHHIRRSMRTTCRSGSKRQRGMGHIVRMGTQPLTGYPLKMSSASKKKWKFLLQISQYLLPLELGNLQLEQTKFPVFCQNFQIPCIFLDRDFCWAIFPVFPVLWVPCLEFE